MGCQQMKEKKLSPQRDLNSTLSKNKERFNSVSTTPTDFKTLRSKYKEYDPNLTITQYKVLIQGVLFDEIKPFEENYNPPNELENSF